MVVTCFTIIYYSTQQDFRSAFFILGIVVSCVDWCKAAIGVNKRGNYGRKLFYPSYVALHAHLNSV